MSDILKLTGLSKAYEAECFRLTSVRPALMSAVVPLLLAVSGLIFMPQESEARKHAPTHSTRASIHTSSHSSSSRVRSKSSRTVVAQSSRGARGHASRSSHSHTIVVAQGRHGRHGRNVAVVHTSKHHHVVAHAAPKPRYAYPLGIFMKNPPAFDTSALDAQNANSINSAFESGSADVYAARVLVRAGVVKYHPLRGGIFWRREPVKYIVMHSTETGIPIGAVRVIESWSSMGMRHPGAQYVVERDGTIYQAVDPDLATVHINIFKTLPGINNDNSIGIEMCHTGSQNYPQAQLHAVTRLVGYLQNRYNVDNQNIITHRYAQQGDHTDPVNFDWDGFLATKNSFRNQAIAYRTSKVKEEAKHWKHEVEVPVNTYMKPHTQLSKPTVTTTVTTTTVVSPDPVPTFSPASSRSPFVPAPAVTSTTSSTSTTSTTTTRSVRINPASIPAPGSLPVPGELIETPVPEPSQAEPANRIAPSIPAGNSNSDGSRDANRSVRPPAGALGTPGSAPLPGEDI